MQKQTFIFFGIQGSGKGTQIELLKEYLKQKIIKRVFIYILVENTESK